MVDLYHYIREIIIIANGPTGIKISGDRIPLVLRWKMFFKPDAEMFRFVKRHGWCDSQAEMFSRGWRFSSLTLMQAAPPMPTMLR